MEIKRKNSNIHCSVTQCKHNTVSEKLLRSGLHLCGHSRIQPPVPECTNCDSFVKLFAAQSAEHAYRRIFLRLHKGIWGIGC